MFNHLLSSKILFHCVLLICQDLQFQDHAEITKKDKCLRKRKGLDLESLEICFKEPACCVPWLLSNAPAVVIAGAELSVRFGFLRNIICLTVLMSRMI